MRLDHAEDLAKFVEELQRETDRGLPLVGTALIDEKLRDTLEAFFINVKSSKKLLDDPYAPLGSFSARLETCYALGLIDEHEYEEIDLLRKVRNQFAHAKHGISFKSEKIVGYCSTLKSSLPEGGEYPLNDSRFRFINSVVCIVLRLYLRPEWVVPEKRVTKSYGENDGKWISVKDQMPPEGMPVIVMGKKSIK